MDKTNIFQLHNSYINEELEKREQYQEQHQKRNRFMGIVLLLVVFLLTLPTYNLVASYHQLRDYQGQLKEMKKDYQSLSQQEKEEAALVKKLQDNDFALKYVRAKYQFSKEGEFVYNIPNLLPK